MITIITGTPGAGKTLYAISKLLLPIVGTTVRQEVDGEVVEHPRTIYTNIRGLTLDHELIDGGATGGLRNWHEWAKPGAVIVFDEVQKIWEPRANGSKVPDDIKALETHRHMGVDFVLITQGLMLTERNLAMLCNRHLHVRRVANLGFAVVYEWDHASRTLLYAKAIAKQPWRYDKKVFKVYKSADLHTKQPKRVPTLVWFIVAALCGLAYLLPSVRERLSARMNPAAVEVKDAKETGKGAAPGAAGSAASATGPTHIDDAKDWRPRDPARPESAPAYDAVRKVAVMPVVTGAIRMGDRVRCFTQQGTDAGLSEHDCIAWLTSPRFDPYRVDRLEHQPPGVKGPEVAQDRQQGPQSVLIEARGARDPRGALQASAR